MKRWLILLLIWVLPLQMSWASVHFCNDSPVNATSAAGQTVFADGHASSADLSATTDNAAHAADACCASGHACHGLHAAMSLDASAVQTPPAVNPSPQGLTLLSLGSASTRIDRPNWCAA